MQLAKALHAARMELEQFPFIDSALYEAELLFMHELSITRTTLHVRERFVTLEEWQSILEKIARRAQGEPMAYILGYRDFYKHRFKVTPAVLIPRPETELIVETALTLGKKKSIADLGAGSGCIGLSLLLEWPEARLWTCDISEDAIHIMNENALALKVSDRVKYSVSSSEENDFSEAFDLVVSNPPYIAPNDERVDLNVKAYEPAMALWAGDNGLEFYKKWLPWAMKALQPKGHWVCEVGAGQSLEVMKIAQQAGFKNIESKKDLQGIERVVSAQKD